MTLFFRHLDEGGHTGHAKEDRFKGQGWDRFVDIKIKSWELFYTDWLAVSDESNGDNVLVIHFEEMVENLEWSMLKVLDFLGFEVKFIKSLF